MTAEVATILPPLLFGQMLLNIYLLQEGVGKLEDNRFSGRIRAVDRRTAEECILSCIVDRNDLPGKRGASALRLLWWRLLRRLWRRSGLLWRRRCLRRGVGSACRIGKLGHLRALPVASIGEFDLQDAHLDRRRARIDLFLLELFRGGSSRAENGAVRSMESSPVLPFIIGKAQTKLNSRDGPVRNILIIDVYSCVERDIKRIEI